MWNLWNCFPVEEVHRTIKSSRLNISSLIKSGVGGCHICFVHRKRYMHFLSCIYAFFLLCIIPHSSSIISSLLLTACVLSPPDSKATPPNHRFIMRFSTVICCAAGASAASFSYPLASGFPNLNSTTLQEVYKLAGSTNLNGSPLFSVPSSMAVYAKALQYSMLILQYLIFGAMLYGTVLHPVCIFPRI